MRRCRRNPRYGPESLERKLSPSGITGIPVAAEFLVPNMQLLVALISLRQGTWPSAAVVVAVLFRGEIADILRRRRFVVEVPGFKARLDRGPKRSRRRP